MREPPIDFANLPPRGKSFETRDDSARMLRWFEFGVSTDGARVDISDTHGDVMVNVPRKAASEIIAARDEFLARVYAAMGVQP